jgi:hypothetical protein
MLPWLRYVRRIGVDPLTEIPALQARGLDVDLVLEASDTTHGLLISQPSAEETVIGDDGWFLPAPTPVDLNPGRLLWLPIRMAHKIASVPLRNQRMLVR